MQSEPRKDMDCSNACFSQREALEKEALRLQLAFQSVNARINQLTPICILPAEVLLYIFRLSSCIDKPRSSTLGWIRSATHVCRRWRHIALESATLWTNICTDIGVEWVAEMFRRARSAPVDVCREKFSISVDNVLFDHLQSPDNMRNVRTLNLSGPSRIIEGLCTPAPSLEKLYFSYSIRSKFQLEKLATLPPTTFGGSRSQTPADQTRRLSHSLGEPNLPPKPRVPHYHHSAPQC